jgi:2-(3-amino-3-carboxypropyl)histidine synthase
MNEFNDLDYDLKLELVCQTILKEHYKTILLQFPEGLKVIATKIKDFIEEKTQANIIISADPCFGACDIPFSNEGLQLDMIVQFGHASMPNLISNLPVMFVEAHSKIDVMPVVKKALGSLSKRVGLITTVQHIQRIPDVADFLRDNGKEVQIGRGTGRVLHDGQVLGCNLTSATSISHDVDCFLFIGSGNFHAIGVELSTKKPVYIADPHLNEVRNINEIKDRLLRQRHGAITQAQKAQSFGIIVGTKPGQVRLNLAYDLKKMAETYEKRAYIIIQNEITSEKLKGFSVEAFVSCACPRIAIDDFMRYSIPILTPQEFKIVLGASKWEDFSFDSLD